MKTRNRILVIGAGASGLFAAITAAECGADVTVVEKGKKPGHKLLMTGNGRCNFTNIGDSSYVYHGTEREFANAVLAAFTPQDAIRKFTKLGIYTTNKNGWMYPRSETATSVLQVLLWRCEELHVKIKCSEEILKIEKNGTVFAAYSKTWQYEADRVILACGSAASLSASQLPLHGFELSTELGHRLAKPIPALVPLNVQQANTYKWTGVRVNANVSLYTEKDRIYIANAYGQVQLTAYGISGIPVFAISGRTLRLIEGGAGACIVLDFFPELELEALCLLLESRMKYRPGASMSDLLVGILPEKLIHAVAARAFQLLKDHADDADGNEPWKDTYALALAVKQFAVKVTGSQGFPLAQSCAGGVLTGEIDSSSCESKITPGLYITGEMLDIDGECGGWNLQFAWSTGYLAGKNAAEG
ncbi:MAG: aminoacetone oxidase family FAD-binding enzyme [Lachnospiraceae bacterium]|nr:aminoacetone oxidase family FAD-binding enzyme [Lachnospiraceae bacterium]